MIASQNGARSRSVMTKVSGSGAAKPTAGKIVRAFLAVILRAHDPIRVDRHFRAEFRFDDAAKTVEEIR